MCFFLPCFLPLAASPWISSSLITLSSQLVIKFNWFHCLISSQFYPLTLSHSHQLLSSSLIISCLYHHSSIFPVFRGSSFTFLPAALHNRSQVCCSSTNPILPRTKPKLLGISCKVFHHITLLTSSLMFGSFPTWGGSDHTKKLKMT